MFLFKASYQTLKQYTLSAQVMAPTALVASWLIQNLGLVLRQWHVLSWSVYPVLHGSHEYSEHDENATANRLC